MNQPSAIKQQEVNEERVRHLIDDVINTNNLELVEDLFVPGLVDVVRHAFANFRAAFPDWHEDIIDLIAQDNRVAVRLRCSGTQKGEFMDIAPKGQRQEVDEVFFVHFRDGKITKYWGLEDNFTRLQQLGQ